jgi:hypothetical protein
MSKAKDSEQLNQFELDEEMKTKLTEVAKQLSHAKVKEYDIENGSIHPIPLSHVNDYSQSEVPFVKEDEDIEYTAMKAYQYAGYSVIRTESRNRFIDRFLKGGVPSLVQEYMISKIEENEDIETHMDDFGVVNTILGKGVPDLFVYNVGITGNIKQVFFSEVKSSNDSVRRSQLKWMMEHSYLKSKIAYVDVNDYGE